MPTRRFPIRFDRSYGLLSRLLFMRPSESFVEVDDREVRVQMAWSFRAHFPRTAVASAGPHAGRTLSRGVHGFAGKWLVNGSGEGIVSLALQPPQRALVLGFPVRLLTLLVSVEDPVGLAAAVAR
jgi:hypothetical protein